MRALLITVGTGQGVEEAIAASIVRQQPEVLALPVSDTSRETLARVGDWLERAGAAEWARRFRDGGGVRDYRH